MFYPIKAWSGFCFYAISTLMSFIYLVSVIEKVENEDLTGDALAIYKSRFTNHQSPEFYDHRDNLELKCFSDILGTLVNTINNSINISNLHTCS